MNCFIFEPDSLAADVASTGWLWKGNPEILQN
jgi:hypothetical protein